jgi:hypothetical protein
MRLSLQIMHFVSPAQYPTTCEPEPTNQAFRAPAPYSIPYELEPTDQAFRSTRIVSYSG